jgi:hypothetical protein
MEITRSNTTLELPASLKYPQPSRNADVLGKKTIYISPMSGDSFSSEASAVISFTLPNSSMLNLSEAYIQFTATSAGTGARLVKHSSSLFSTVRARLSTGEILEEITNYNTWGSINNKMIPADYRTTVSKNLTNGGDVKAASRMLHRPFLGLFQTEQYIPAHVLPSIVIEFTLQIGSHSTTTTADPSGTFIISNCVLVLEKVDVSQSYTSDLLQHIEKNGLNMEFNTTVSQSFNIAAGANQQSFRLGAHRDLSNVWFCQTPQTSIATADRDGTNLFSVNGLVNYVYTVNGILETQPIITLTANNQSISAYIATLKCYNLINSMYAGTNYDLTIDDNSFYGYAFASDDLPSDDTVLYEKNLSLDLTFVASEIAVLYMFFTKHTMLSLKDNNIIVFRSR